MRWIAALVLCTLAAARTGPALSQDLEKAEALIRAGKAEAAWAMLAPLEREYAGRADFDYLLGLAALESGRPNRATFVLERVITANPGHLAARLDMARAYFALRDLERAEREFRSILASDAPPEARALSQRYLDYIAGAKPSAPSGLSGYVEFALGRDTNVSAAAAQSAIFVPALGVELTPDPQFQRRPDDFALLGAGIEYAHALDAGLGIVGGADVRERRHGEASAFDSRLIDLQVLLNQRLDERNGMHYSVRYGDYRLDDQPYRDTLSAGAQWSRTLDARTRLALAGQGYRIRYRAAEAREGSSDLIAASVSASRLLQRSSETSAFGGLYAGYDNAVAGRADGDRRIFGASFGLQRRLASRVDGFARVSWIHSDYMKENADFVLMRRDRQLDAALGVGWEFAEGWILRAQVLRTDNDSNVPFNDHRRTESSLALQRIWD
jgi:hypothetical protein